MKYTNRLISVAMILCICICLVTGCGSEKELAQEFNIYNEQTSSGNAEVIQSDTLFSESLCVSEKGNQNLDKIQSNLTGAAGVFNTVTHDIPYCKNLYKKIYPASTTKILTAYLAIQYGHSDEVVTISHNAVSLPSGASNCGLKEGDQVTMEQLLYGLMLESGNDAAIAIAEHISGSVDKFANKMNQTAKSFGATHSNFVNPNGLHDDNHYTTVYDLYLIFNQAIQNQTFRKIIASKSYQASYLDANDQKTEMTYQSTNQYVDGDVKAPTGSTVVGGKTGTTDKAGHCLVLLSQNKEQQDLITIVMNTDSTDNLYLVMNHLLKKFSNL